MIQKDFWGREFEEDEGEYLRNAYPRKPGTGAQGESCRTCKNLSVKHYGATNYYKCALMNDTNGPGTDIRLKSPACKRWERR